MFHLVHNPALAECSLVWPFQTGFVVPDAASEPLVWHAEIYPSAVDDAWAAGVVPNWNAMTRDQKDAAKCAHLARAEDRQGTIAGRFGPPAACAEAQLAQIQAEEGWILFH